MPIASVKPIAGWVLNQAQSTQRRRLKCDSRLHTARKYFPSRSPMISQTGTSSLLVQTLPFQPAKRFLGMWRKNWRRQLHRWRRSRCWRSALPPRGGVIPAQAASSARSGSMLAYSLPLRGRILVFVLVMKKTSCWQTIWAGLSRPAILLRFCDYPCSVISFRPSWTQWWLRLRMSCPCSSRKIAFFGGVLRTRVDRYRAPTRSAERGWQKLGSARRAGLYKKFARFAKRFNVPWF